MATDDLRLLIGWKEISDYLNCSVSTATRRLEEGLPVFRVGGSVRAFAADIDGWIESDRVRAGDDASGEERSAETGCVFADDVKLSDTAALFARERPGQRFAIISLGIDTSEYKRMENRLASSEDKYRWVLETVPVWIWETEATGRYVYSNVAALDILGYRPEELAGFTPEEFLLAPEEIERCQRQVEAFRTKKKAVRGFRCGFVHRDGSLRWLETDAEPIFDVAGDFAGIRGVSRDITERKLAEEKEKEHLYHVSFLSRTAMDFVEFEPEEDLFRYVAAEVEKLAGAEALTAVTSYDEGAGEFTVREVAGVGDRGKIFKKLTGAELEGFTFPTTGRVKAKLFSRKFQKMSKALDELTDGAIPRRLGRKLKRAVGLEEFYAMGLTRDQKLLGAVWIALPPGGEPANRGVLEAFVNQAAVAVQRKSAEDSVFWAAAEWRRTFDAVPEIVLLLDRNHTVVRANRSATERLGRDWPEVLGNKCYRLLHGRELPQADCPLVLLYATGEEQCEYDIYVPALDAHFDVTLSPIREEATGLVGAVLVGRDVTERKRTEKLAEVQRDLAHALAAAPDLPEAARLCVQAAIRAGELDAGAMYVVEEATGALDLLYAEGYGPEFVEAARHYDAETPNAALVREGEAVYQRRHESDGPIDEFGEVEGLRVVALLPVTFEGEVVACLTVASHTFDAVRPWAQRAVEGIAAQAGGVVARLRAQESVQKSQVNLQNLFDAVEDFLFVVDREGRLVHVNPVVCDRLGYPAGELVGAPVGEIHPSERREEVEAVISEILAGRTAECRIPLCARDGTEIAVETVVTAGNWGGEEVLFGLSRDITERLRVEKIREREREAFRIIAEAALEAKGVPGLCRHVLGGLVAALEFDCGTVRLLDWERQVLVLTAAAGFSRRLEMEVSGPVAVEDGDRICAAVARTGEAEFFVDVREASLPDGTHLWVKQAGIRAWISWPVLGSAGELLGLLQLGARNPRELAAGDRRFFETVAEMFATALERKQVEEGLRKSEAKHRLLLESFGSPVLALDRNMNVFYHNDAYAEFVGRPREELEGQNLLELFPAFAETDSYKAYVKALSAGTRQEAEGEFEGKYFRTVIYPMPWGILAIASDITERKQAEEALQVTTENLRTMFDVVAESEGKYRALFEKAPLAVTVVDCEGCLVEVNAATEELTGYAKEELVGKRFEDLLTLNGDVMPSLRDKFAALLRGEEVKPYELTFRRKGGARRRVHVTNSTFARGDGDIGIQVIAEDITGSDGENGDP